MKRIEKAFYETKVKFEFTEAEVKLALLYFIESLGYDLPSTSSNVSSDFECSSGFLSKATITLVATRNMNQPDSEVKMVNPFREK